MYCMYVLDILNINNLRYADDITRISLVIDMKKLTCPSFAHGETSEGCLEEGVGW